ncbi:MAG: hypothetical protein JRI72_10390 [Deltaproteobacteria bacterium]|nr:hypothetical protein [Deltaproteobacteria bacterium]
MYNKTSILGLLIAFLLFFVLSIGNVEAQLDLKKLTEKKPSSQISVSKKVEFFDFMKKKILTKPRGMLSLYHLGKQKAVRTVLEIDYGVKSPSACFDLASNAVKVIDSITSYYQSKFYDPKLEERRKEYLVRNIEHMKNYAISGRGGRCQASSELPKIMKFIEDYNQLASSAFNEGKKKKEEEGRSRIEKAKREQEERELKEKEKTRKRVAAKFRAQKQVKAKIDQIIKYANTNRTKLEKESKIFRKDVSGVWYTKRDYFTIDLFSPNKIIMIGNSRPLPVQTGRYDKDNNYIIVYVTKDGKISRGRDEKPFGFVIRKVKAGGREFKLGISTTDGIEVGSENILGFVRDLK